VKKFATILLISMLMAPLTSMPFSDPTPSYLTPIHKQKIIRNFKAQKRGDKRNKEKLFISRYYGRYSGCYVFTVAGFGLTLPAASTIEIAGYKFHYAIQEVPWVYKNGIFMEISKAFETGWITEEDVGAIYEKRKTAW